MMKITLQLVLLFVRSSIYIRGANGFDRVRKIKSASRLDTTLTVQIQQLPITTNIST